MVHVFVGLVYCEELETVVHVFVGLVYCEIPIILFDTRIRKSELGNISKVRNLKQWSMFQRFMANTWTTKWSLNSVFKRSGADLVTTMTSFLNRHVSDTVTVCIVNCILNRFTNVTL